MGSFLFKAFRDQKVGYKYWEKNRAPMIWGTDDERDAVGCFWPGEAKLLTCIGDANFLNKKSRCNCLKKKSY